jgi:chorismate-pyruvate lyase
LITAPLDSPANYIEQMRTAVPLSERHSATKNPPSSAEYWLTLTSSMTQAIADKFIQMPLVSVLSEGVEQPTAIELQRFDQHEPIFARHILLCINNNPLMMARTVTPASSPDVKALKGLLERPLAELLFSDERWQRQDALRPLVLANGLFGRSCLWRQSDSPESGLLVEEFFLPGLY